MRLVAWGAGGLQNSHSLPKVPGHTDQTGLTGRGQVGGVLHLPPSGPPSTAVGMCAWIEAFDFADLVYMAGQIKMQSRFLAVCGRALSGICSGCGPSCTGGFVDSRSSTWCKLN